MAHAREAITSGDLTDLVSSGASATVYPTEDTVLQVLQSRFRADLPYARCGATSYVVVNPLKQLANLNDLSAKEYEQRCYRDTSFNDADMPRPLQPHAYELAARIYLLMRRTRLCQAVLTRGVTSSGKSTTVRLVMDQLLRLSAHTKKEQKVASQLKAFNTLLDAFGNAKTQLNANASRHAQYTEMHFDIRGRVSGGKVLAFGLDKGRLVKLSQEERTYHVFYQFLAGATPTEQDTLHLEDPSEYALLASSGCYRLPAGGGPFGGMSDDAIAMDDLRASMKSLGFKSKHVHSIFSLLSSILLLGNLTFIDGQSKEESASVTNMNVLDSVARLLGVESEELAQNLTCRTSYVRKEVYTVLLDAEGARKQRDTMVQALYGILFAFVVETANHKIASADADHTTSIVFLDLPGAQSKSTSGSLIAAQGHASFEDFTIHSMNELVHSYVLRNTFDDRVGYNAHQLSDGIGMAEIRTHDNVGCVELLRGIGGGGVPERVMKRPEGGVLGVLHKAATSFKSGKTGGKEGSEVDADVLKEMSAKFGTHASFVAKIAPVSGSAPGTTSTLFGIQHYTGGCTYDVTSFTATNADLVDPSLVSMLRFSSSPFVAKVFSGPSISSEKHPKDEAIAVQTQVSSRPIRVQSDLPYPDGSSHSVGDQPQLDPGRPYPVTTQLNHTVSSLLMTLESAKLWSVACIRPNDSGSPNSFDKRRVKAQIRALLIPDIIARRKDEYVVDYEHHEFCERYVPTMQGTDLERINQFTRGKNGWREGVDFAVGLRYVWIGWEAWKMAEDVLREREKEMRVGGGAEDAESVAPAEMEEAYEDPTDPWKQGASSHEHGHDGERLLNRTESEFQDPNDPFQNTYGGIGAGLKSPSTRTGGMKHSGEEESAWGSEWDKKRELSPGPPAFEKGDGMGMSSEMDLVQKDTAGNTIEEVPTSKSRRWWLRLTWAMTWWIPTFCLTRLGGMKRPDVRLAWREKVTICMLIFFLCATVVFYIVIFGRLLCPDFDKAWEPNEVAQHTGDNDFWVSLHGQVYDISNFWRQDHSDIIQEPATHSTMEQLAGTDLTPYFPPPLALACPTLVTDGGLKLQFQNFTPVDETAIHYSGAQQVYQGTALNDPNWYVKTFLPTLRQWHKGPLVWDKKTITQGGINGTYNWAIWDNGVYDLTNYFYTISQDPIQKDALTFLEPAITDLFQQQPGQDISKSINTILSGMSPIDRAKQNACLKNVFFIGGTDFRKTARCQVQNYLLLSFSVLLVSTIAAKFFSALQLTTKRHPEMLDKFVLCQIPCYTEGEESLRSTIDSIASLKYDDKRKLMFIICDGNIIGSGNDRPTPRIVLDILGVDPKLDPEPLLFKSIGEGSQQLNYGKVYSGLYEFEGHVVPYMVIVKTGKPTERSRPGNRGKRDSQILLLHYLNRVHFDMPMSPLELEIYHQMRNVIGIDPAFYEYIFTVDADTSVEPDSLNRLVACTSDDSKIIGLCGETKVHNEEGSWWTMIQVYEYYISHHLAKAFESLFGSVTCLPGCFSLYRIRTADKGRPVIISNRIIDEYAENNVDTLHKKNLFSLGEDRYLTTLLMKNFPTYKLKFTPDAIAHTVAPERWSILLSQRRRWINSTIHNLCELVFLPELCGFCCFSMRFIVFIDLLGTIILPATTVYLVYLIVVTATGKAAIPILSLVMIGAVYGLQAVIFILKREFMLVGWMVVYLLSYPVYSFFLPIYSFWCMDDFSWGNTRLVIGEGNSKKVVMNDDLKYDESMIPLKKFSEYEAETWENATTHQDHHSEDSRSVTASARPSQAPRHAPIPRSASPPHSYNAASQAGDYYRDTNLTHNSSSNPNIRDGPPNLPQMGGAPSLHKPMSFMGQPFPTGPPSITSSQARIASMGGMPPMGFPNPNTQSMYGMMGMGMPSVPRNSVMTNMNMYGGGMGGGSASGSAFAGAPQPTRMSTFSTMNLFSAADTDPNPNPSDEELLNVLKRYLSAQDLMTVTKKTAREAVTNHFPNADLASKRDFLNKSIDDILATE